MIFATDPSDSWRDVVVYAIGAILAISAILDKCFTGWLAYRMKTLNAKVDINTRITEASAETTAQTKTAIASVEAKADIAAEQSVKAAEQAAATHAKLEQTAEDVNGRVNQLVAAAEAVGRQHERDDIKKAGGKK